jgi:hypothetical protein
MEAFHVAVVKGLPFGHRFVLHPPGAQQLLKHSGLKLRSLVPPQHPGRPMTQKQALQMTGRQLPGQAVLHQGVKSIAAAQIQDAQDAQPAPRHQLVLDKVHGPNLTGHLGLGRHEEHRTFHSSASLRPRRSLQVHLPIQPIHTLGIDSPALPPKYCGDMPVAKGGVAQRQFLNALLEFLGVPSSPIPPIVSGSGQLHQGQSGPQRQAGLAQLPNHLPFLARAQNFF